MITILVSLLFLGLLVGSFTALAPRGPWSEDSLAYNLYQIATGSAHGTIEVVSTVGVILFLAAVSYFAAKGVQSFAVEIGAKTFWIFVGVQIGALAIGEAVVMGALPALSRMLLR